MPVPVSRLGRSCTRSALLLRHVEVSAAWGEHAHEAEPVLNYSVDEQDGVPAKLGARAATLSLCAPEP